VFEGLIGALAKRGLRRAYQGGSTPWAMVGVVLTGISVMRWLGTRVGGPQLLSIEELLPGESVTIRALLPGE